MVPSPDAIYAWQVLDGDGRWGTISAVIPAMGHGVLVTRNVNVAAMLRPIAELHGQTAGQPVALHRFVFDADFDEQEALGA